MDHSGGKAGSRQDRIGRRPELPGKAKGTPTNVSITGRSEGTSPASDVQGQRRMLKLILADNQAIFRAGAAKVLAGEDEIRGVAQTQNYEQTLMALEKFRASVLIFASLLHPPLRDVLSATVRHNTKLVLIAENTQTLPPYVTPTSHGSRFPHV